MRNRKLTGAWAGFEFRNGHLITPEGRALDPESLRWWSLTCAIAREWRTMMAERRGERRKRPQAPSVAYLRDHLERRQQQVTEDAVIGSPAGAGSRLGETLAIDAVSRAGKRGRRHG